MTDISSLDAHQMRDACSRGQISPVEITRDVLDRIDRIQPGLNAFSHVDHARALAAARASEARWHKGAPLSEWDGVPATVKDMLVTKHWTPGFGSHVIASPVTGTDAPAVARLREAGCVLLGMTTTPELGWKGVTDSPRHGVTRNAWNRDVTPGGSSGGAAVAAALNLGAFHIGTDGGGSIRMPAAFSGIVGFKPTFGRVPAWPASIMGTLAHVGPMTRTVRDSVAMLNLLSGADGRDWRALPPQPGIVLPDSGDLRGLRIAYSPDLGHIGVDPGVATPVKRAAGALADLGAEVDEIGIDFADARPVFETLWFGAARHRLQKLSDSGRARVDPGLLEATESVAGLAVSDCFDAQLARADLAARAETLLQTWDALITPTVPVPAFRAGLETPSGTGRWTGWAGFNYPFNLSQQPSCSIPCGFTASGLPVGAQITTAKYRDETVLCIAAAYQAAHPVPWPDASSDTRADRLAGQATHNQNTKPDNRR